MSRNYDTRLDFSTIVIGNLLFSCTKHPLMNSSSRLGGGVSERKTTIDDCRRNPFGGSVLSKGGNAEFFTECKHGG